MTILEPTPTTGTESSKRKVSKHRQGREERKKGVGSLEAMFTTLYQMNPFSHVDIVIHMTLMSSR